MHNDSEEDLDKISGGELDQSIRLKDANPKLVKDFKTKNLIRYS